MEENAHDMKMLSRHEPGGLGYVSRWGNRVCRRSSRVPSAP